MRPPWLNLLFGLYVRLDINAIREADANEGGAYFEQKMNKYTTNCGNLWTERIHERTKRAMKIIPQ